MIYVKVKQTITGTFATEMAAAGLVKETAAVSVLA